MATPTKEKTRTDSCFAREDFNPLEVLSYSPTQLSLKDKNVFKIIERSISEETSHEGIPSASQKIARSDSCDVTSKSTKSKTVLCSSSLASTDSKINEKSNTTENVNLRTKDNKSEEKIDTPDTRRRKKRNVLTRMTEHAVGPLNLLYRSVNENIRVKVWTRSYHHVRGMCTGYLVAYDKHFNLALVDVDEIYRKPVKRYKRPTVSMMKQKDEENKTTTRCEKDSTLETDKQEDQISDKTVDTLSIQLSQLKQQLDDMSETDIDKIDSENEDLHSRISESKHSENKRLLEDSIVKKEIHQERVSRDPSHSKINNEDKNKGKEKQLKSVVSDIRSKSRSSERKKSDECGKKTSPKERSSMSARAHGHDGSNPRSSSSSRVYDDNTRNSEQRASRRSLRDRDERTSSKHERTQSRGIHSLSRERLNEKHRNESNERTRKREVQGDRKSNSKDREMRDESKSDKSNKNYGDESLKKQSDSVSEGKKLVAHSTSKQTKVSQKDKNQSLSNICQRHVNQLFIRGEQVVMVALDPVV